MKRIIFLFLTGLSTFIITTLAHASPFGASFTYPIIAKDPENLHGYKGSVTYQPPSFNWDHVQVYFDAGFGHWFVSGHGPYRSLNIYSVAPYLRYYLIKKPCFSPYVEASLGLAYLSKTHLDEQKLGIHFSFQDMVGIGAAYGADQRLFTTLNVVHYSNGSISKDNSGITIPLMITVGYRF